MILDEGTESLGNGYCFTELKENATFMKHLGPMFINFYGYPLYSGEISGFLKHMLMLILGMIMATLILQANRQFAHEFMSKLGKSWKDIFLTLRK